MAEEVVHTNREDETDCQTVGIPLKNKICRTNPGAKLAHIFRE
jgi:hypothetical protein